MAAKPKRKRLSAFQILLFNSGNTMPSLVLSLFSSYMLTFQTKVLGLPSNVVGLLWIVPSAIDAFISLMMGYMSDNVSIPCMSRRYGQRKTWHLIGCLCLVVALPILMNECFLCKGNISGWEVTLYYIALLHICYIGWSLTQINFLALIPEVATKQSEMVKLGAVSTAVTLTCGIFVYVVTWVLLGDDVNSTLSEKQRPAFIKLGLIITGTGAFLQILFHVGVSEPGALGVCSSKEPATDTNDNQFDLEGLQLETTKEKSDKENTTDEAQDTKKTLPNDSGESSHVNPTFVEEKICDDHNPDKGNDAEALREILKKTLSGEQVSKNNDNNSLDSDDGYTSEGMSITDSDNFELFMPETFVDMVPVPNVILSSRRNSRVSGIGQFISSSRGPSRTASRKFQRSASQKRRASTDIIDERQYGDSRRGSRFNHQGFGGSRRPSNQRVISRKNSRKRWESPNVSQFPSRAASVKKSPHMNERTVHQDDDITVGHPTKVRLSLTPELITEQYVINRIEEPSEEEIEEYYREEEEEEEEEEEYKEPKAWKTLLKNPEYYKLGFAYMFTRLAQNMTNSYMPLFLTDWLNYPKIAIAYFPLVILFSGVVASFGGKKLNTLLGNKWTFCLGSIMVMGASGWFYLLTPENRSVMYVPAILTGCGTSIMFVTSLALAADFVNADRKSGAFLMASMGLIAKVFNGTLFFLLQEFTPLPVSDPCPECISYTRHVFSLGPGVCAFLGLLAFILFIPATIQCKPIVPMEDAETQTDESSFAVSIMHDVNDDPVVMTTHEISVIEEDEENETMENASQEQEMNTAL